MSLADIDVSRLSAQIVRFPFQGRKPQAGRDDIRTITEGKWPSILAALGLEARYLTGKHGPCPICGGKDRFRFDNKGGRGTWICSRCGAGDGVALVMRRMGLGFGDAIRSVRSVLGIAQRTPVRVQSNEDDRRAVLNALWRSAGPIRFDDAAGLYLRRRAGIVQVPDCLRFAPWVRYQADPVTYHPCMIAMVRDAEDRPVTLHRTYLNKEGSKATVADPRRLMPGSLPAGSAVRLSEPAETMGIAEGIETALSAAFLSSMPVWAALTAGNLAGWVPPAGVRSVTIFGDNDVSFTGQAAAYKLAHRLHAQGFAIVVEIPGVVGEDWNNVHQLFPKVA